MRYEMKPVTRERLLADEECKNLVAEAFWIAGFYKAAKMILSGEIGEEEWEVTRKWVAEHPERFPELTGRLHP